MRISIPVKLFFVFIALATLGAFSPAVAAVFNVNDAAGLQTALNTAATNDEADTVNLAAGTYNTIDNGDNPFTYTPDIDEVFPLTITGAGRDTTVIDGGWSGGAAVDGTPGIIVDLTIFRGDGGVGAVDDSSATVTVQGLTFRDCYADAYGLYGGLSIETHRAPITVSNCAFADNNGADGGGLWAANFDGDITLENSSFTANKCHNDCPNGAGAAVHSGRGNPRGHLDDSSNHNDEGDIGNVTVTACTFTGNGDSNPDFRSPYADGGGLSARAAGGDITITGCTFSGNAGGRRYTDGGGVSAMTFLGDITFSGNTLTDNTGGEDGGGALLHSKQGMVTVSDNTFTGNSLAQLAGETSNRATNGGGLHVMAGNGSVVTGNTFTDNTISGTNDMDGAGAHIGTYGDALTNNDGNDCDDNDPCATAGVEISDNTFTGNVAESTGGSERSDGAGLHARAAGGFDLLVAYNTFTGNVADAAGGGAYLVNARGDIDLLSNHFDNNTARDGHDSWPLDHVRGGGAMVDTLTGTINVINNTFTRNTVESSGGGGLGINIEDDTATANLFNNIAWDNIAVALGSNDGDDIFINDVNTDDDANDTTGAVVVMSTNNYQDTHIVSRDGNIPGSVPNVTENGALAVDPMFAAAGDPGLDPKSPMIDAGDDTAPQLPAFDVRGVDRADTAPVDIGAWEFNPIAAVIENDGRCFIDTAAGTYRETRMPVGFFVLAGLGIIAVVRRQT